MAGTLGKPLQATASINALIRCEEISGFIFEPRMAP